MEDGNLFGRDSDSSDSTSIDGNDSVGSSEKHDVAATSNNAGVRGSSPTTSEGKAREEGEEATDSSPPPSQDGAQLKKTAPSTGEHPAPTGGGAAGGFLGQVEKSVEKQAGGRTDAAPLVEGKAREGEREGEQEEEEEADSPPPSQGGAQPKKTLPDAKSFSADIAGHGTATAMSGKYNENTCVAMWEELSDEHDGKVTNFNELVEVRRGIRSN